MIQVRTLGRGLGALCMLMALAACGSVPSYYTDRVSASAQPVAAAQTRDEPAEAAPRRRVKRQRAQVTAAKKQDEPAPVVTAAEPVTQTEPDNTGSASPTPPRASKGPQESEADLARMAARERAINRTMNTICRGC